MNALWSDLVPDPPTSIQTNALDNTKADITVPVAYNGAEYATSYKFKQGSSSSGPFSTAGTSTTTSYTYTDLTPGTTYYFTYTAIDAENEESQHCTPSSFVPPTGQD